MNSMESMYSILTELHCCIIGVYIAGSDAVTRIMGSGSKGDLNDAVTRIGGSGTKGDLTYNPIVPVTK